MHLCSLNHKSFLLEKQVKNLLLSLSHTVGVSQKLLMETLTCVRFGLRASQVTLTRSSLFRFTLSASVNERTDTHTATVSLRSTSSREVCQARLAVGGCRWRILHDGPHQKANSFPFSFHPEIRGNLTTPIYYGLLVINYMSQDFQGL